MQQSDPNPGVTNLMNIGENAEQQLAVSKLMNIGENAEQQLAVSTYVEVFGLCIASGWMALTSSLRTTPFFRIKILLLAEQENVAAQRLAEPYGGVMECIKSVKRQGGLTSFWRGWHVSWLQLLAAHLTNIPLFYGYIPFGFLRSMGFVEDPFLHGIVYAMVWDCLLYPLELAYIYIAGDPCEGQRDASVKEPAAQPTESKVTASSETAALKQQPLGLTDFLQATYERQSLAGLFNGYIFTFGRMIMRALSHVILTNTVLERYPGASLCCGIGLGVISHVMQVVHVRYVIRGRFDSPNPPYKGVIHCLQSVHKEGTRALFCGLHWSVAAAIFDQILQGIGEGISSAL